VQAFRQQSGGGVITFVVPTMPGRESLLSRCLWSITAQGGTPLVVDGDGGLGDKVNATAAVVDTPYMTIVDDDDYICGDYLMTLLPRLGLVDYVGFKVIELNCGKFEGISASQGDYGYWGRRTRGPVPKGVTLTKHFQAVKFGNDYKADRRWSGAIRERVETWSFVDRALYVHDWWPHDFGAAAQRDVGEWPHIEAERMTVDVC
jgi:hypothetical protein